MFLNLLNLEMSWNKILPVKTKIRTKSPIINIISVKETFDCRRKRVQVHCLDSPWIRQLEGGEEEAVP